MVFMGCGFTSGGQELGSMFGAAVCQIQAGKQCIESFLLVLKDRRSFFSQSERFSVELPLDRVHCLQKKAA